MLSSEKFNVVSLANFTLTKSNFAADEGTTSHLL